MSTPFSGSLKALRESAGFKTAYAYYHGNGGNDVFRFSYRMYLAMEEGKRLPAFKYLPVILHALRLIPFTEEATRLTSSWLEQKFGKSAFEYLLKPMLRCTPPPAFSSPLHKAIQKSLAGRKFYVSPEQLEAIAGNETSHMCWTLLSNDKGEWTAEELAGKAGLVKSDTAKALEGLAAAGLLKKGRTGKYKCPMAGMMIELPRQNMAKTAVKLRKLRANMIARGEEVYSRRGILRAEMEEFANFLPLLSLNLSTAQTYSVTKRTKKTAIFGVECKVSVIREF